MNSKHNPSGGTGHTTHPAAGDGTAQGPEPSPFGDQLQVSETGAIEGDLPGAPLTQVKTTDYVNGLGSEWAQQVIDLSDPQKRAAFLATRVRMDQVEMAALGYRSTMVLQDHPYAVVKLGPAVVSLFDAVPELKRLMPVVLEGIDLQKLRADMDFLGDLYKRQAKENSVGHALGVLTNGAEQGVYSTLRTIYERMGKNPPPHYDVSEAMKPFFDLFQGSAQVGVDTKKAFGKAVQKALDNAQEPAPPPGSGTPPPPPTSATPAPQTTVVPVQGPAAPTAHTAHGTHATHGTHTAHGTHTPPGSNKGRNG